MIVTCCQFDIAWEQPEANHAKVQQMLAAARPPGGSLVLLPEMFATGFSMNLPKIADRDGKAMAFLKRTAREFDVNIIAGLVTMASNSRGQNMAVLVTSGGQLAGSYQKMHSFTPAGEADCFEAGDDLSLWHKEDGGWAICPFICYDLRFPEVFRHGVRAGANFFTVIANWPASREHHWVSLLVARAIENQAYVAAVNRCGTDPKTSYSGRSLIIDPRGQIVADAGDGEGLISAQLDLPALIDYRTRFPALADMRSAHIG
jgi:predicted amidohydrolase